MLCVYIYTLCIFVHIKKMLESDLFTLSICAVQDSDSLEDEIMAILSLSSSEEEMQQRLAKIVVATNKSGDPVTTEDLVSMCSCVCVCLYYACDLMHTILSSQNVSGPLAMLLKDTLKPVLMQTVEVRFNSEKCCMTPKNVIVIFQNKYFRITAHRIILIYFSSVRFCLSTSFSLGYTGVSSHQPIS